MHYKINIRWHYKTILLLSTLLTGCAAHCTKGGAWSSYYDSADPRCSYFCADPEEKYCAKTHTEAERLISSVEWKNAYLDPKLQAGQPSSKDFSSQLKLDKHECMLDALKIPVPSPSCTQKTYNSANYSSGNSVFDAYQRGAASAAANMGPDCDYSSVKYAKKSQQAVFWSCMSTRNWQEIWRRKSDGKIIPPPPDRPIAFD